MGVHRSTARLADGREIIFFDERPRERHVHDLRDLEPRATGAGLRLDPLTRTWTAVAAHRQGRTFKPPADQCPLCPSVDGRHTEVPAEDYDVVVFENRFPSFAADADAPTAPAPFVERPGYGRCEVICFTSDHDSSFVDLTPDRVRTVLLALVDRTVELTARPGVEYVYCFENRGEEIGVTLLHPHGQIYAMPLLPPRIAALADTAAAHRRETGRCVQCDALAAELADGRRIVAARDHWVAYVPFAARWPYELRLVPRRHVPDLPSLTGAELDELGEVYLDALRRIDSLDTAPVPYIAGWQQAPTANRADWHLATEIFTLRRAPGRLKYLAGIESGAGLWINDVTPEAATERLRAAVARLVP